MTPTEASIALNMLPTMGPVRLRKLLEVFETPERILAAKRDALRAVEGIGREVVDQIANWESLVDLPAELQRVRDFGATVITAESPFYSKQLREIHAPPIVLYVWGELSERDQHAIAVIGSRRTTHYGLESAKKLSYQLAYAGLTVISGWSQGLLVVEAGANSGALISVAQALEQGRNVYAVPGHINAPSAIGSNRLIQQGAKLVMDASDILDDLQILLPDAKPAVDAAVRALPTLSDDERRVYEAIRETETAIDDIATKAELPSGTVSSTLLRLELKKLVKQLPGKYFVKLG